MREAIAAKVEALYGRAYDPGTEITVTAGRDAGHPERDPRRRPPGDEVIVLELAYDSYEPGHRGRRRYAGVRRCAPGTFRPDFDAIAAALTLRTRAIPSTRRTTRAPRSGPATRCGPCRPCCARTDAVVISDEVYEHMVHDGARHERAARHAELAARSFIVSKLGKTYHVTGGRSYTSPPRRR